MLSTREHYLPAAARGTSAQPPARAPATCRRSSTKRASLATCVSSGERRIDEGGRGASTRGASGEGRKRALQGDAECLVSRAWAAVATRRRVPRAGRPRSPLEQGRQAVISSALGWRGCGACRAAPMKGLTRCRGEGAVDAGSASACQELAAGPTKGGRQSSSFPGCSPRRELRRRPPAKTFASPLQDGGAQPAACAERAEWPGGMSAPPWRNGRPRPLASTEWTVRRMDSTTGRQGDRKTVQSGTLAGSEGKGSRRLDLDIAHRGRSRRRSARASQIGSASRGRPGESNAAAASGTPGDIPLGSRACVAAQVTAAGSARRTRAERPEEIVLGRDRACRSDAVPPRWSGSRRQPPRGTRGSTPGVQVGMYYWQAP